MQIDFHLGVTYIMSRLAGFSPSEANTIASSAQYVDDAVHDGTIMFDNGSLYNFIASAHKMLDYRNFKELAVHRCWVPFHFIPANELISGSSANISEFAQRMVCRPNSKIAQDAVEATIQNVNRPYALHLLGVMLHAFVDTWAHQGFAGITHQVNEAQDILDSQGNADLDRKDYRDRYLKRGIHRPIWRKALELFAITFVSDTSPIGHGAVLSYPDQPYLNWKYINWNGETISRDNPNDFTSAAYEMFHVLSAFRKKAGFQTLALKDEDFKNIVKKLRELTDTDSGVRLEKWHQSILNGEFSFGRDTWIYNEEGEESWLYEAFGFSSHEDFTFKEVKYQEKFLNSNWKQLHDALFLHRFHIVNEILPRHKLCIA